MKKNKLFKFFLFLTFTTSVVVPISLFITSCASTVQNNNVSQNFIEINNIITNNIINTLNKVLQIDGTKLINDANDKYNEQNNLNKLKTIIGLNNNVNLNINVSQNKIEIIINEKIFKPNNEFSITNSSSSFLNNHNAKIIVLENVISINCNNMFISDSNSNLPIDPNFNINLNNINYKNEILIYKDNIIKAYNTFINLKKDFNNNIDELSKQFTIILHNIFVLNSIVSNNSLDTINVSDFKLTNDQLNKIMIVIQSKYALYLSNFSILENITFNFDQNNYLTELIINFYNPAFNSLYYKKMLAVFLYNGLKNIKKTMSDLDKIIILSNYVCDYINYHQNEESNDILLQSLDTRNGLCRHYTTLMMYLLNAVQIPNYCEIGNLFEGATNRGLHVWNVVCLNNNWYVLDLTGMDFYGKQNIPLNASSSAIKFNSFFLSGKNNQKNWQTFNTTFQKQSYVTDNTNNNNVNAFINESSTFLYNDLWANDNYNTILRDFNNPNAIAKPVYWNNYWYTISYENNNYCFYKLDLNNNKKTLLFTKNSQFKFNLTTTIAANNLYFFVVQYNNKYQLMSLNLNNPIDIQLVSNISDNITNNDVYFYLENNQLKVNNKIIINDVIKLPGYDNNTIIEWEPIYNAIGKVYQSATLIGNNFGQFKNSNNLANLLSQQINTQQDLNELIKNIQIDLNLINFNNIKVLANFPQTLAINKNEFINQIQPQWGYLKLNLFIQFPELIYNHVENDILVFKWLHNDVELKNATSSTYTFPNITMDNFNSILGSYECVVTNKLTNQSMSFKTDIIETNNSIVNNFYPYYLSLSNYWNTINNKDLNIIFNNVVIDNNHKLQILKDNKLIYEDTLNSNIFKYQKSYAELKNNEFGEYTIKYCYNNDPITTFNYLLFKFS